MPLNPEKISPFRRRINLPSAVIIPNLLMDDHGSAFLCEYDACGNIVGVVDGNGNSTEENLENGTTKRYFDA